MAYWLARVSLIEPTSQGALPINSSWGYLSMSTTQTALSSFSRAMPYCSSFL
jgi:hypothetical protein